MANINSTVRFIGDASSLLNAYRQIRSEAAATQQQINASGYGAVGATASRAGVGLSPFNQGQISGRGGQLFPEGYQTLRGRNSGIRQVFKDSFDTVNPYIANATTKMDLMNQTFVTTGTLMKRAADGTELFRGEIQQVHGDVGQWLALESAKNNAILQGNRLLTASGRVVRNARDQWKPYRETVEAASRALYGPRQLRDDPTRDARIIPGKKINRVIQPQESFFDTTGASGGLIGRIQQRTALRNDQRLWQDRTNQAIRLQQDYINSLDRVVTPDSRGRLQTVYRDPTSGRRVSMRAEQAHLAELQKVHAARDQLLQRSNARLGSLHRQANGLLNQVTQAQTGAAARSAQSMYQNALRARDVITQGISGRISAITAQQKVAELATPPPSQIASLLANKQAGGSPAALQKLQALGVPVLSRQFAENANITRDLTHGISTLNSTYTGLNGVVNSATVSWDRQGTVITKFNSHLSGLQNWLKQTATNLQKVIQWGIATSLVLGAANFLQNTISNVIELDKVLQRFSLTAQMSDRETSAFFTKLAKVAYDTATPLGEMVSAADDIAIATRKAGQSTEEWQQSILNLSNAVGILTNLTGIDTVKATDLLTSTMKQLDLNSNQLLGVLNKITAVGGGQSVAIADIIEGLGNMAEAAAVAGLSLDETIGTVQVLSQVTSKSSKEVATAFKNLTGSLDSPGATKVLDSYNIALKDNEGNIRNILEVYKDINKAIAEGRIKAGDVKAVVKAIAGGPRRAPDAAALLGAVEQIDQVTERAANATNEAILANARVLDTMAAKITQLKTKFDELAYSKFGEGILSFLEATTDFLTSLLEKIENINPAIVGLVLQFGALAIGIKLGTAVFRFFWGSLQEVAAGMGAVAAKTILANNALRANAIAATAAGTANAAAATQILGANGQPLVGPNGLPILLGGGVADPAKPGARGILGAAARATFSRRNIVGAGIAAGAGAAAYVGSGAIDAQQDLGGLIAGIGTLALVAPIPIPHLKALGVGLLAAGTAMTFLTGETKESTKAIASSRQEILTAIDAHMEAQRTIAGLQSEQSLLQQTYRELAGDEKSHAENSDIIAANLERQGQVVLQLRDANKQLEESYQSLSGAELAGYDTQIKLAKAGAYTKESLQKLSQEIATAIFKVENPEFSITPQGPKLEPVPFADASGAATALVKRPGTPARPQGRFALPGTGISEAKTELEHLNEAALKTTRVLELFDDSGTKLTGEFANNAQTIDAMRIGLEAAAEAEGEIGEKGKAALKVFNDLVAAKDAFTRIDMFTEFQKTAIQAQSMVGLLKPEQADIAQGNLAALRAAFESTSRLKPFTPPPTGDRFRGEKIVAPADTQQGAQAALIKIFTDQKGNIKTGKLPLEDARALMDIMGVTNQHKLFGLELSNTEASILAQNLGIQVEISKELQTQIDNTAFMIQMEEALSSLRTSVLDDYSQRNAEIQKQFMSGDITQAQRNSMLGTSKATRDLQNDIINLYDTFNNLQEAQAFASMLRKIPGLESMIGKEADEAAKQMVAWAADMEFTGKSARKLQEWIQSLAKWANILSGIKARFKVDAQLPTKELLAFLKALKATLYAAAIVGGKKSAGGFGRFISQLGAINQAIAQTTAALKAENSFTSWAKNQSRSTGGGGGGGGGSSRSGKDYSELDVPEEIGAAVNRSALIKQAIRDARALQKKIPGAAKEGKNDVVTLLNGMQKLETVRGIREDLLRRALDNLAEQERKRLEFETKADMIRRIRVGAGDWSAIANVPVNSKTGVSVGGNGAANVTLNLNGTVLTPAQFQEFANMIAAALKRQLAS